MLTIIKFKIHQMCKALSKWFLQNFKLSQMVPDSLKWCSAKEQALSHLKSEQQFNIGDYPHVC